MRLDQVSTDLQLLTRGADAVIRGEVIVPLTLTSRHV